MCIDAKSYIMKWDGKLVVIYTRMVGAFDALVVTRPSV